MKSAWIVRLAFFVMGLMGVALGATLSTITGMGVSPITSVSYAISQATGTSLSRTVLTVYSVMVAIQFLIRGKQRRWMDLGQIPVSLLFSTFLGWFETLFSFRFDSLAANLAILALAIVFTGSGIAMSIGMQLIPNPPDGLVATIAWSTGRELGLVKNFMDLICVAIALAVDLIFSGALVSIGIGTVLVCILTGRVVSLFNRFCKAPMLRMAGMPACGEKAV